MSAFKHEHYYEAGDHDNPIKIVDFTYYAMGNRLTSAKTTGNWTYNANNELQGFDDTTFEYDPNGNLTKKAIGTDETNYIYDVEDRLIRVEDGSSNIIAEYYYDPFGRRLWKEVGGTRTNFAYSGEGLIGEYNAAGSVIKSYGYEPDSTWGTNPLFQKIGNTYYWYQNDHSGTPQKLIETSGFTVWAATYDSFGNCHADIEIIENNFRFPGQYYDAETGLYYNYHRYYDPDTGRYLRADPFGDGLNLYTYCYNNPTGLVDPLGLCVLKDPHNWLAGLGMIPLVGIVFDVADALLYLAEGEYALAVVSGLAAIPIAGYLPRIAQYGGKLLKPVLSLIADHTGAIFKSFKKYLKDEAGSITIKLEKNASKNTPKWPSSPNEMDDFLGVPGKNVPDGPTTPGRNKVTWEPNKDTKITYEEHPYHPNAPDWHKGPHWHLDTPEDTHVRHLPGDDIPGY
ncbi:MAG: RHS repeat-associated core domain-containing protein [Desulfobacteraceae bacterium]